MKENGFINEFEKFIMRGNVMDMAVGVIVGGAFTAIVTSLNQDILTPKHEEEEAVKEAAATASAPLWIVSLCCKESHF